MSKKSDLTEGSIARALLAFVVPLVLGSLIQQLYVTADAVIVGQFAGKEGLAAIDSVHTLFRFPINFMNGLAAGATILISGYYGAGDRESLHCSVRTAITLAFVLGIGCSMAGVLLVPQMLAAMSVPDEIWNDTLSYCRIYFGGIWTLILYNMAAGILRAFGDSRRPLYVLILCSMVNIAGDFLLVGGLHMGVRGAAAATVISQASSVFTTFYFLSKSERANGQVHIWHLHFCREHMASMLKTGFPLALQSMLFPFANTIVQASVNTMGTDRIAAWGICDKMDMLIWLIADTMGTALTTYTAQNIGAGKTHRVRKGVLIGTGISVGAVSIVSFVLFSGARMIGSWFVSSKDVDTLIPFVIRYIHMMAPFFSFYAIAEALSGACCGTGDTIKPMITTLVTICLLRVICIWTILPHYRTMECIVWIYIASWIAAGVSYFVMYNIKIKKLK
jgi:putative MATE family efflux protein